MRALQVAGHHAVGACRELVELPSHARCVPVGNIDGYTRWSQALGNVECVIHTAARVHVMVDKCVDPLASYREVNRDGTLRLARQAVECGVKRFVFISSIKVNGESTRDGAAFSADDVACPVEPYGISKLEAERGLLDLAAETGLEVVVIRPVLIYGPGVRANFYSMMHWLNRGVPLPLGRINNKRSLVALENLVSLVLTCIAHPQAVNEVFLASDGEDLSTTELLLRLGQALQRPALLMPVPCSALIAVATLLGKRVVASRLCSSLQVDISKTREILDWAPSVTVDEALLVTARHYLNRQD